MCLREWPEHQNGVEKMDENTKNEKSVEPQVTSEPVVVVERAPRLVGGLSVKTRVRVGKKAASGLWG